MNMRRGGARDEDCDPSPERQCSVAPPAICPRLSELPDAGASPTLPSNSGDARFAAGRKNGRSDRFSASSMRRYLIGSRRPKRSKFSLSPLGGPDAGLFPRAGRSRAEAAKIGRARSL